MVGACNSLQKKRHSEVYYKGGLLFLRDPHSDMGKAAAGLRSIPLLYVTLAVGLDPH